MKRNKLLLLSVAAMITVTISCKTVGRLALKYWTRKQVKEFVHHCEEKAGSLVGTENAHQYCDCAVDVVADTYRNYEDIKSISLLEVLRVAEDCSK